jgi:hypothetical protein
VDPWDQEVPFLIPLSLWLGGFVLHLGGFAPEDWHVLNTFAFVSRSNKVVNHENPRSSFVQPVGKDAKKQLC